MEDEEGPERWRGGVTAQLKAIASSIDAFRAELHDTKTQMSAQHGALSEKVSTEVKHLHERLERTSERFSEKYETKESAKDKHHAIRREVSNLRTLTRWAGGLIVGGFVTITGWLVHKGM